MNRNSRHWALVASLILAGCGAVQRPPIRTVPHVDLPRFMGDWYVIATTFTFRQGSYDGVLKSHHPE